MTALESLKEKLSPLRIYNLLDTDLIVYELTAYSVALQAIYDMLEEAEREMFILTAESYGLELRENILDMTLNETDIQKRRQFLISKETVISNPCTKSSIIKVLLSYGIECDITEDFENRTVTVNITNASELPNSQAYYTLKIKNTVPAQINSIITFS